MTWRTRLAAFVVLAATLLPAAARAQMDAIFEGFPKSLTWKLVVNASNLHFVLIPNGKTNIVFVWGGIGTGDALRFSTALNAAKPVAEVQFYSPGGSLIDGLKIGSLIRARGFATRVPEGARCVSACNFAFMGGVVRTVDQGASFEVHMFSNNRADELYAELQRPPRSVAEFNKHHPNLQMDPDRVEALLASRDAQKDADAGPQNGSKAVVTPASPPPGGAPGSSSDGAGMAPLPGFLLQMAISEDVKDIQQESAQIAALIARYLVDMRLSLDFLTAFANIPNNEPRGLSRDELKRFNIVNN